jgi:hypothetical protein
MKPKQLGKSRKAFVFSQDSQMFSLINNAHYSLKPGVHAGIGHQVVGSTRHL